MSVSFARGSVSLACSALFVLLGGCAGGVGPHEIASEGSGFAEDGSSDDGFGDDGLADTGTSGAGDTSPGDDGNPPADTGAHSTTGDPDPATSGDTSGDGGLETSTSGDDGVMETTSDGGDTGGQALDLSGWEIRQTMSDRTLTIPDGVQLWPGDVLVVGRNATRQQFEAFWGISLSPDVVYLDGADFFPTINGDETYELADAQGLTVDGPTIPLELGTGHTRIDASMDASTPGAWQAGNPDVDASPGTTDAAVGELPYISEYSDAVGIGSYVYEFVEIHRP